MANSNPRECQLATKGTAMSNGTAFPGWYITFQTAVLQQLPRPDVIDQNTGLGWADNQEGLRRVLASVLCPPLTRAIALAETQTKPTYLKRLFEDEKIILGPTDGTRTIAQANDVFPAGIDSDFVKWGGLDIPVQSTDETVVVINEYIEDGTFTQVFESAGRPRIFTQHQIIDFCVKHKDKLRQGGYGTFFPFLLSGNLFVAHVNVYPDGLDVRVHPLSHGHAWNAEYRYRFMFLQS